MPTGVYKRTEKHLAKDLQVYKHNIFLHSFPHQKNRLHGHSADKRSLVYGRKKYRPKRHQEKTSW